MTRRVATAVDGPWESGLVTVLGATAGYTLTRRCADLPDLLASAAAGLADVVLVSPGLRSLDRPALHELQTHGVAVAGVVEPGDDVGERRLRQLGLDVVVHADLESHELDDALDLLSAPGGERAGGHDGAANDLDGAANDLDGAGTGSAAAGVRSTRGRIVAVWGPTGAPGRTTVAVNLAAELAATTPTLLVDLDTWGSSVAQSLGMLDEAPGVAAAARAADQGVLDTAALARVAPFVADGLRVLTGLPRAHRWTELRAASVSHLLEVARSLASVVVVDCGFAIEDDEELSYDTLAPRRNATTLAALEAADDLLVVGAGDPVGLQRLVRAVQDLDGVACPAPRVVVNKVRASAVGSRPERRITEALARFAGLGDLTHLPWDPVALDAAMLTGAALRESAPQSTLRSALVTVATQWQDEVVPRTRSQRRRAALRR